MKIFYKLSVCLFLIIGCDDSGDLERGSEFYENTKYEEIFHAVLDQDTARIKELFVNRELQINYQDSSRGNTLLHIAVMNGKLLSVQKLLELGAQVQILNFHSESPLMRAVKSELMCGACREDIVKVLIEKGANVNELYHYKEKLDGGRVNIVESTPLITSSRNGCIEIVKTLVSAGAKIDYYLEDDGNGAITASIMFDHLDITRYFIIECKASVPKYCLVRDYESLTVIDFLNEKDYTNDLENNKIKKEIIGYLMDQGYN